MESRRAGDGLGSSSQDRFSEIEAMSGEYLRVLDTLSSLKGPCSMYQRQPPAMKDKRRLS